MSPRSAAMRISVRKSIASTSSALYASSSWRNQLDGQLVGVLEGFDGGGAKRSADISIVPRGGGTGKFDMFQQLRKCLL